MTVDEAVQSVIGPKVPGFPHKPRVYVRHYGRTYCRKPLRRQFNRPIAVWCVQLYGFPALTNPRHDGGGLLVFDVDYSQ